MDTPFTDKDLDTWLKNELNVIFIGYHGCGKTERVKAAFERAGKKWKYFSCPTLDPWTDLIGIPTVKEENDKRYIDYIKPKDFALDQVECIFLDEFNRAKSKVKNACMELIQFKSINGVKFNNLKVIWVAINPEPKDEEQELRYDVEKLDPAIKDRFHLHIHVPYTLSEEYFTQKYGKRVQKGVFEWWGTLDEKTKLAVSPRRLDYAIDIYQKGIDVKFVLPFNSNHKSFITFMNGGTLSDIIKDLFDKKNQDDTEKFFKECKNILNVVNIVIDNYDYLSYFSSFIPKENLAAKINDSNNILEFIIRNHTEYADVILNASKQDPKFKEKIGALDLVRIKNVFDFSKLTFSRRVDYENKIVRPMTVHLTNNGANIFKNPSINDNTVDIVKELIAHDYDKDKILESFDPKGIFNYLQYVIENGSALKLPYGHVLLIARIGRLCIETGKNPHDIIINSGDRFKMHILKNILYFL